MAEKSRFEVISGIIETVEKNTFDSIKNALDIEKLGLSVLLYWKDRLGLTEDIRILIKISNIRERKDLYSLLSRLRHLNVFITDKIKQNEQQGQVHI